MSHIEDLLRDATAGAAAEVRPESIPPLDVAALPLPRRRPRWWLSGPFAPLVAAAAVLLIVVLSLVVRTVIAVPRPASPGPSPLAGAPPYYVTLTATGTPADSHSQDLTVRSTATGAVLATVTAPRPYGTFNLVDGTGNDRTFLVGAQVWHPDPFPADGDAVENNIASPVRLYWLRFDPSTGHATLSPLPIPQLNGEYASTVSVSPDGTRLAVQYEETSLRIYDLPSGAERSWSFGNAEGYIGWNRDDPASIGWTADDQTISFLWAGGVSPAQYGVHLAGVAALMKSAGLPGPSRLALPMYPVDGFSRSPGNFVCDSDPIMSPNGADILCGGWVVPAGWKTSRVGTYPEGPVTQGFAEFSAATGKLITILGAWRAPLPTTQVSPLLGGAGKVTVLNQAALPYLLWASPDGTTVIGTANGRGIVADAGRAQSIPWSARITVPGGSAVPGAAW
jgi:hypothetical protein